MRNSTGLSPLINTAFLVCCVEWCGVGHLLDIATTGSLGWQDKTRTTSTTVSITIQHTKECLCIAHITALGGSAGLNFSARPIFDYGVDGDFRLVQIRDGRRAETGFSMAYQAKSTVCWLERDGQIIYDLEAKTYNDMVSRTPEESTLLLILLCLPRQAEQWHAIDPAETVLRNCCYWYLPPDFNTVPNTGKKRIFIPIGSLTLRAKKNRFLNERRFMVITGENRHAGTI